MGSRRRGGSVFFILVLLFVVTMGTTIFIVQYNTNAIVSELTLDRIRMVKRSLETYVDELGERAMQWAHATAEREDVKTALLRGDAEALAAILREYSDNIDIMAVCDSNGVILARTGRAGADIAGSAEEASVSAAGLRGGKEAIPVRLTAHGTLEVGAGVPVYYGGELLGSVTCLYDLTNNEHVDMFKERTACEATFFIGAERAATTVVDMEGKRIVGTKADTAIVNAVINNKQDAYIGYIDIYGKPYGVHYSPLISRGEIIGMLFTGIDINQVRSTERGMNRAIFFAAAMCAILSAVVVIVSNGYAHRMHELSEKAEQFDVAEAANKAKSAFLAHMSHEIRTPMNSIIGFTELAQEDVISPKTREYLGKISESAEWLLTLVNDVLDLSKVESGKMELERVPFDLHDVFTHCQTAIMPKADEKGLQLYCYAEPSTGKKLLGDPVRLRQALMNVLSNAVKFTNVGTVKLLASIASSDETSVAVRFEIKDSGIGMTTEQIDRVFLPFMQADSGITRRYGGTGLGLSITKNIVEMMGGKLEVDSTPSVGSKFTFTLAFDTVDRSAAASMETPHRKTGRLTEKPLFDGELLVCEDNPMNQQVICEHLNRVGLRTIVANNGKEGVDIAAERLAHGAKPFDLIFMDIHMPVMDGLDTAAKISELGVKTPIVAMTANVMANDLELYGASGMAGYLGKPFTSQELWKCLLKYLKPIDFTPIDKARMNAEYEKTQKYLREGFVKSNKNAYENIIKAADSGDRKLAHRLAHTLKGLAAQINEERLRIAALAAETALRGDKNILTGELRAALERELTATLEKLERQTAEQGEYAPPRTPQTTVGGKNKFDGLDMDAVRELIKKLEPMLDNINPKCVDMLDEIRAVFGTSADDLARLIEEFEFEQASRTLADIKKGLT